MKKILLGLVVVVVLTAALGYAFRTPLFAAAERTFTRDMFVPADPDDFDPGLAIGEPFPPIEALHQGEPVRELGQFMGERGLIFIANRSASW